MNTKKEIEDLVKYRTVVEDLKKRGFNNIKLKRANNLITGLVTKEGSIQSMTIGGSGSFSEKQKKLFDTEIVIVVNTFKLWGCDDITEVAE